MRIPKWKVKAAQRLFNAKRNGTPNAFLVQLTTSKIILCEEFTNPRGVFEKFRTDVNSWVQDFEQKIALLEDVRSEYAWETKLAALGERISSPPSVPGDKSESTLPGGA